MSSDSEDDCYGNIAQKLQSIKSKYQEDEEATNLLDDSLASNPISKEVNKAIEIEDDSWRKNTEVPKIDSDVDELSLDTIIAQNSKKRVTRNSKRNADISEDNILPGRGRKRTKATIKSNESVADSPATNSDTPSENVSTNPPVKATRGRGRPKRGRRGGATSSTTEVATNVPVTADNSVHTTANSADNTSSVVNATVTETLTALLDSSLESLNTSRSRRGRGRGRRSNSRRRGRRMWLPNLADLFPIFNLPRSISNVPSPPPRQTNQTNYPTYSVGNTHEYPDECYDQPLFNNQSKSTKTDDVIVLGELENDSIDENEELSVKVYWQNREHVKFTIRRFQKLTQIFDFFSNRENVSHDKLLFTYNDKILKIDDTPDLITYSIVKFIDGGIINQSVSKIIQKDRTTVKDGIKLKFQCQNVKKPFETMIRLDDKLAVAMMMCAEHIEKPLDKLKFEFDGDSITGKSTPRDLELEGGECIDVKFIS